MKRLDKTHLLTKVKEYLFVTIAGILNGVTVYCFVSPGGLMTGGFSGIALAVSRIIGVTNGISPDDVFPFVYGVINVPLAVISLILLRGDFTYKTIWATLVCAVTTYVLPLLPIKLQFTDAPNSLLLTACFGGIIIGYSMYLASIFNGSNGGTEVIARIVSKYNPQIDLSKVILVANLLITIGGSIVQMIMIGQSVLIVVYSLVYIFVGSKVMGMFVRGIDHPQKFMIVTRNYEQLSDAIVSEFKRGLSVIDIVDNDGYDTKNKMIMVIVQYRQASKLKKLVQQLDESAFTFTKDMYDIFSRPTFNRSYTNNDK